VSAQVRLRVMVKTRFVLDQVDMTISGGLTNEASGSTFSEHGCSFSCARARY